MTKKQCAGNSIFDNTRIQFFCHKKRVKTPFFEIMPKNILFFIKFFGFCSVILRLFFGKNAFFPNNSRTVPEKLPKKYKN